MVGLSWMMCADARGTEWMVDVFLAGRTSPNPSLVRRRSGGGSRRQESPPTGGFIHHFRKGAILLQQSFSPEKFCRRKGVVCKCLHPCNRHGSKGGGCNTCPQKWGNVQLPARRSGERQPNGTLPEAERREPPGARAVTYRAARAAPLP